MNSQDIIKKGDINLSRIKLALERNAFLLDRDTACKLTHPHSLRKWDLSIPDETRLKLLKLRSDAFNEWISEK